jgi:serine/threonine protein kinase/Tfp pilus assembly protein PilF
VIEIHGFVGSVSTTAWQRSNESGPAFPEAMQTIGGFYLVRELGRGSFARVFLAQERQLANRPVALKVSRRGSREPQALARLQHTHIVPIHSYRTDPATGFHLLCMPYFGGTTLGDFLSDARAREARSGAELIAVLDRLSRVGSETEEATDRLARREISSRPYVQAIAWWGARLAEALQHAHERGILHRDIKPSNVLVTTDGVPMLLDFNLAADAVVGVEDEPAGIGGTLAYMSPEHLDALSEGRPDEVGSQSDIYGLGVLLYEMMGARPFRDPRSELGVAAALKDAAEERRKGAPSLRGRFPEVTPAFEAVVRKCLEPAPGDRYESAAALAEDLSAVSDDRWLTWAREPLPSRMSRWMRYHRRSMILAAAIGLAGLAAGQNWLNSIVGRAEREREIGDAIRLGNAREEDHPGEALLLFEEALTRARAYRFSRLESTAHVRKKNVENRLRLETSAKEIAKSADHLRFAFLGYGEGFEKAVERAERLFGDFSAIKRGEWRTLHGMEALNKELRAETERTIEDLLFHLAWGFAAQPDKAGMRRDAIDLAAREAKRSPYRIAWEALGHRAAGERVELLKGPLPPGADQAEHDYRLGLVAMLDPNGKLGEAKFWLEQSAREDLERYWPQYLLGDLLTRLGETDPAREHLSAAVHIRQDSPWAHLALGHEYLRRRVWTPAIRSTRMAIERAGAWPVELPEAHLDLGYMLQSLGDFAGAEREYRRVLRGSERSPGLSRRAWLNLAALQSGRGERRMALETYARLLQEDAGDREARVGHAATAFELGDAAAAIADLDVVLETDPGDPELLFSRAKAGFLIGRLDDAEDDARHAWNLRADVRYERLLQRVKLATGRTSDLVLDEPNEVELWPFGGARLGGELLGAAERILRMADAEGETRAADLGRAAMLFAAVGDARAIGVADEGVAAAPGSVRALVDRAIIFSGMGDLGAAESDLQRALALDSHSLRASLWLGRVLNARGEWEKALERLAHDDRILLPAWAWQERARALEKLGRPREALDAWNRAIGLDSDDARSYLGRAYAFIESNAIDQACDDLEQAIGRAEGRPWIYLEIARNYARCLSNYPDRVQRIEYVMRRWGLALGANARLAIMRAFGASGSGRVEASTP